MKEQELERTFLPSALPAGVLTSRSKVIVDTYLPLGAEHSLLRLRQSGDTYEITKKEVIGEGVGKQRVEHTIKLTKDEYDSFATVQGMRVAKTRYYYEEGGHTYEVGVYDEALKGLVIVDIEFQTLGDMEAFSKPEWLLTEVSHVKELRAGMLCRSTYADVAPILETLGYSSINVI